MPRRSALLLALAAGLAALAWCWRPLWDIDLFTHVAVGRAIRAGGIPHHDLFSAADPGAPWTTFQWLYQVLVAWLHDEVGGLRALRALHFGVIAAGVALWAGLQARRAGAGVALASAAVLMLLFEDRVRARPHVFEFAGILALTPLVWGRRPPAPALLFAIAAAALWANLHAVSALWWLVLVGAWAAAERSPRAAGPLLGGALAILTAPGAWDGLSGALASHRHWPAAFVPELRATWAYRGEGWWGWTVLAGVAAGVLAALDLARRRAPPARVLACGGTALAACLLARWAWLAAIPLGGWLATVRPRLAALLALPCAVALGARVGPRWSLAERLAELEPGRFPVQAVDWMDAHGLRGPTDTTGAWGGYVLYRLHPPATVLADGRLVFGPEVADLLRRRGRGDAGTFDEAADRFGTRVLLWPARGRPPLDPARWALVHADPVAEVWLWRGGTP